MKRLSKMMVALALGLGGGAATAGEGILLTGGDAVFTLNLPPILPPLIVIQPGVSVVGDVNAEVFYANGYYWSRRDQSWYRAHDHKGSWARVDSRNVPVVIRDSPPGRYKNYKGEKHDKDKDHRDGNGHGNGNGKGHGDGHS
jgi:hypothetical protein